MQFYLVVLIVLLLGALIVSFLALMGNPPFGASVVVSLTDVPDATGKTGNVLTNVVYTFTLTNTGSASDTFTITKSGEVWTTALSKSSATLAAGANTTFTATVSVPVSANNNDTDAVTVTATSGTDPTKSDSDVLTTTASGAYRVYDTFTDTDTVALASHTPQKVTSGAWTEQAGTWTITSNRVGSTGSGELRAVIETSSATQDFSASLITAASGTIDAGLSWRTDGAGNEYWLRLYNGGPNQVQYWEANGSLPGSKIGQYNVTIASATTYLVRVTASGTTHTVYLDGVSIITFEDATLTNTKIGLCKHSGDNGSVWDIFTAV